MKVELEVLTPLHIGSGIEVSPSEYYVDREAGRLVRLDMDALFLDPAFAGRLEEFISAAGRQRYIGSILDRSLLKKYPLYSLPIRQEARLYILNNQTVVKSFVKSAGRVFVPGSSVKGSILSAMIWRELKKETGGDTRRKIERLLSTNPRNSWASGRASDDVLELAFSFIAEDSRGKRFSRWLDVSDTGFKEPSDCLEISLARVKGARRGGELPVLYETLKPGESFELEMKAVNTKLGIREMLQAAHEFYLNVADRDGVEIDSEPYLLRLGQGSGAFSTSLLLLAAELDVENYRVKPPRTRKRVDGNVPLGFVRLSV